MPLEWNLYYWRWIIEDGEPDLSVGELFDWFSLEFWTAKGLAKTGERAKSAIDIIDYKYRVVAELIYLSDKACVIDFGLRAVGPANHVFPGCKQGDYVTGEISIGLPLCTEVVPEDVSDTLRHKWRVKGILADMTPYIPHPDEPRFFFRDESQIRHEPVASTNSVRTRGYVIECSEVT